MSNELSPPSIQQMTNGHPLRLQRNHFITNTEKDFSLKVISLWNSLPKTVDIANRTSEFKCGLNAFLIRNGILSYN